MNELAKVLEFESDGDIEVALKFLHARVDALEEKMLESNDVIDFPLVHRFVPGMYIREIFMPKGSLAVSVIHNTEHPYVCLKGDASVFIPGGEVVRIKAGHIGVTKPGTRRVLFMHEDTVWVTFHPCEDGETVQQIEDRVREKHLLPDGRDTREEWRAKVAAKKLEGEK